MFERAPLPQIGDKLGEYSLVEVVSDDGLIALFEAVEGSTRRVVMLEVLAHDIISSAPASAARRLRELEVVLWLGQPQYAPKIFAQGETSAGLPWTAFERLRGETLQELLVLGDIGEVRGYGMMLQLLAALADLHGRGLVHGHLQPNSILGTKGAAGIDEIKLLDLGNVSSTAHKEFPPGSPFAGLVPDTKPVAQYGAPEVLAGSDHTVFSDVFTAGLLLFETLTGAPAFDAEDGAITAAGSFDVSVLAARRKKLPLTLPERWKNTPIADIVTRATAYQPNKRYPNGLAFYTALSSLDPALLASTEDEMKVANDAKATARFQVAVPPKPPAGALSPRKEAPAALDHMTERFTELPKASALHTSGAPTPAAELLPSATPTLEAANSSPTLSPVLASDEDAEEEDLCWPEVAVEDDRSIVERLAGRKLRDDSEPSDVQPVARVVPEFVLPTEHAASKWKIYAIVAALGAMCGAGVLYFASQGSGEAGAKQEQGAPVAANADKPQDGATQSTTKPPAERPVADRVQPQPEDTPEHTRIDTPGDGQTAAAAQDGQANEEQLAAAREATAEAVDDAAQAIPEAPTKAAAAVRVWTLSSEPPGAMVHAGDPVNRVLCEATPCEVALPEPEASIPLRFELDGHDEAYAELSSGTDHVVEVALETSTDDSERRRALRRAKRRELRRAGGNDQRSASNPFGARTFD